MILAFLFPVTLFAQQRTNVTGRALAVFSDGEGQEVLPHTNSWYSKPRTLPS